MPWLLTRHARKRSKGVELSPPQENIDSEAVSPAPLFGIRVSAFGLPATPDPCCHDDGGSIASSNLAIPEYAQNHHGAFQSDQLSSAIPIPPFLRPLPASLQPEDITYLKINGALDIPSPQLQNALLRAYVEFVHPYLPVIDLVNFIDVLYHPDGSKGKVSLALYQAVMFAGAGYVDMRDLRNHGFLTRKDARRELLRRTRVSLPA